MSKLLILGNKNKYTFYNSVLAASSKSVEIFKDNLAEIYVIHTKESFKSLFQEDTDWLKALGNSGVSINQFVNRVIEEGDNDFVSYVQYIKEVLESTMLDSIIIDISNGTTEKKTILCTIAYILDIQNIYYVNSSELLNVVKSNEFAKKEIVGKYYKKFISNKDIDGLAYLNLTTVTRYKEKIDNLSNAYSVVDEDNKFFKNNLLNAIKLKIESDNMSCEDNTLYRISSTAISASLEDLIDKLLLYSGEEFDKFSNFTLGKKILMLQNRIKERTSMTFDFRFFQKFNEFMLYLRNSTTHKSTSISESEKFKADLSVQMSLIFLDYYSSVVFNELKNNKNDKEDKITIKNLPIDTTNDIYYGLDGDNTGARLEELLSKNESEKVLRDFSNMVAEAKKKIVKHIDNSKKGKVIFAEGDDLLFKGKFTLSELEEMQNIYKSETKGLTCSIGYGKTFKELLFSMKLAKMKRNDIQGIEIINKGC